MKLSLNIDRIRTTMTSAKIRASVLFFSGLGLTIHEALTKGPERPSLYILYAGMMGFPLVTGSSTDTKPPSTPESPK